MPPGQTSAANAPPSLDGGDLDDATSASTERAARLRALPSAGDREHLGPRNQDPLERCPRRFADFVVWVEKRRLRLERFDKRRDGSRGCSGIDGLRDGISPRRGRYS
jgi:hypothetical protein